MLPGLERFREHGAYRDWEYEKVDIDLAASEILDYDSDDNLSEDGCARKKRRIESHGYKYMKGQTIHIYSAKLRGPFGAGWTNPWKKSRVATRNRNDIQFTATRSPNAEKRLHDATDRQSNLQSPKIVVNPVSPIELPEHHDRFEQLPADCSAHRRESSHVSDRTLDWLRYQGEQSRTPEPPTEQSFITLGPTPSKPQRLVSASRPATIHNQVLDHKDAQLLKKLMDMPSSRVVPLTETSRRSPTVQRQVQIMTSSLQNTSVQGATVAVPLPSNELKTHASHSTLNIPDMNDDCDDQLRIGNDSPEPCLRNDGLAQASENLKGPSEDMNIQNSKAQTRAQTLNSTLIPNNRKRARGVLNDTTPQETRHIIASCAGSNVLQPKLHNKGLPISTSQSVTSVKKQKISVETPMDARPPSEQAIIRDGLRAATLLSKQAIHLQQASRCGAAVDSMPPSPIASRHSESPSVTAAITTGQSLTHTVVERVAERAGSRSAVSRLKRPQNRKKSGPVSVVGMDLPEGVAETSPHPIESRQMMQIKHPYRASPITSRDTPGFAYRRASASEQQSPRQALDKAHINTAESVISDRACSSACEIDENNEPSNLGQDTARTDQLEKESQDKDRGYTAIEDKDVDTMTTPERIAFINKFTNKDIPQDGDPSRSSTSTGAKLRKAMRLSGASFWAVEDESNSASISRSKEDDRDLLAVRSLVNGTLNAGTTSIPNHQLPQLVLDSNLSTQAAYLKAHQMFQDDLLSPIKPIPSFTAINSGSMMNPPAITPFRRLNSQLQTKDETPENVMSTQSMLDQAAGIVFSTIKKPKAKKRASFAPEPHFLREDGGEKAALQSKADVNSVQKPDQQRPSSSLPLNGLFNFLAEPEPPEDIPATVSSMPASSSLMPVPSWTSSATSGVPGRSILSGQEAQRRQEDVDAEAYLDDMNSFLVDGFSLDSVVRG